MARQARQGERAHRARFIVRPLFAALVASGIAAPTALLAATIPVTTGGDAGTPATCTLRQAVASLNGGTLVDGCTNPGAVAFGTQDEVDLAAQAGTIALAGATPIEFEVSMRISGPGAGALTVSGANASRVFLAQPVGPFVALTVNDLTIANGLSAGPGGCILGSFFVQLNRSVVTGCAAQHSVNFPTNPASYLNGLGGAVAAYSVQLNGSTVIGNTAQTAGGGVFAKYAALDRTLIANNTVTGQACDIASASAYCATAIFGGGGILAGAAQLVHSTVSGNTVNASALTSTTGEPPVPVTYNIGIGGGITQFGKYQPEESLASLAVKSTIFGPRDATVRAARRTALSALKPKAVTGGGARAKADGYGSYMLAMHASTLSGNRITGSKLHEGKYLGGGAFASSKYYTAEIANSTISGNTLDPGGELLVGGGLFVDSAEIFNSTITGNNGLVAVAFKYSPQPLLPPTAKSAKSARAAAIAAAVRGKIATLRGAKVKSAANKAAGPPVLVSTIVAANPADYDVWCGNCTIAGSNNLIRSVDPATSVPPDTILGQDPKLTPLGDHGGEAAGAPGHALTGGMPTHLLYVGSPAIDSGSNPEGFNYEQRFFGFPRVLGPAADIGATEGAVQPDIPVPIAGPWLVAALSALLGMFGLATRRRRRA